MSDDKWKIIIGKLLAKAEDPATTPEERETIQDRVVYLMAKFSIDQSILDAKEKKEYKVIPVRYKITNPYKNQRTLLLNNIGITFGCSITMHMGDDSYTLYGHEDDQEKVFILYNSLLIQMFTAMASAQEFKPTHEHGKRFNTSFVNGFVLTVISRVKDAYTRAKQDVQETDTGNGAELVLVDRKKAVDDIFNRIFPKFTTNAMNLTTTSAHGSRAGHSAGRNADIGQTGLSGRKSIGS